MDQSHTGDLFFFTFAGDLVLSRESSPAEAIVFEQEGFKYTLLVPQRTRPLGWNSSPQVTKDGAAQFIPVVAGYQNFPSGMAFFAGINDQGRITMFADEPTQHVIHGKFSADTFAIEVTGPGTLQDRAALGSTILEKLFRWLRIATDQWWAGRSSMVSAPKSYTGIGITSAGLLSGDVTFMSGGILVHTITAKAVTAAIWTEAVGKVVAGKMPKTSADAYYDVAYYQAQGEQMTSLLLGATSIEQARDDLADAGKLSVNGTHILKHLTTGLERGCGRNIRSEEPELYEFLSDLWFARGNVAHGKPFFWKSDRTQKTLPGSFAQSVRDVLTWLASVQ